MELAIVLLVVLLFILGLVGGLKAIDREKPLPPAELLAKRFAKGEIGEAEYLRSLAILEHGTDFVLETERPPLPRESGAGDS